jgi:hypothetical protein
VCIGHLDSQPYRNISCISQPNTICLSSQLPLRQLKGVARSMRMAGLAKSCEANHRAARNNNGDNNGTIIGTLAALPTVERSVLSFSGFYEYDNSLGYSPCREPTIRNPVFVITASQSTASNGHPAARSPTRATFRVAGAATTSRLRSRDTKKIH